MLQKILRALERRKLRAELDSITRAGLHDVGAARVVWLLARLAVLSATPVHPSHCCQRCGDPIGWLGRFWQGLRVPLHSCPPAPERRYGLVGGVVVPLHVVRK